MNLSLRDRIAEWLLEAVERPDDAAPVEALIVFARATDEEGRAALAPEAAAALAEGTDLFERTADGARLRRDLLGDLGALRDRARRFADALAECRRRAGPAPAEAGLDWLLAAAGALFDSGLFFEVHELLEPAWGRSPAGLRTFLQGLIQIAVGLHHHANRNLRGAVTLLTEGAAKLEPFLPRAHGLELERFHREALALAHEVREQLERGETAPLPPLRWP